MARANIIDMIQNQETNGASLISRDTGAFVKKDKIEEVAKKEFVKAIQAGTLDLNNLDFEAFLKDHMKDQYIEGKILLEEVKKFLQPVKKDEEVKEDSKEDSKEENKDKKEPEVKEEPKTVTPTSTPTSTPNHTVNPINKTNPQNPNNSGKGFVPGNGKK